MIKLVVDARLFHTVKISEEPLTKLESSSTVMLLRKNTPRNNVLLKEQNEEQRQRSV